MDFTGMKVETRVKFKLMAAMKGVPLCRLLDELLAEAWERGEDMPVLEGVSGKPKE